MHLMYTLDEAGNRVYTLKVCHYVYSFITTFPRKAYTPSSSQKITDAGKITKSAHPGSPLPAAFVLLPRSPSARPCSAVLPG